MLGIARSEDPNQYFEAQNAMNFAFRDNLSRMWCPPSIWC